MSDMDLFKPSEGLEKYMSLGRDLGNNTIDFLMGVGGFASDSLKYVISDVGAGSKKLFELMKSKATTKNLIIAGSITAISIPVIRYFV